MENNVKELRKLITFARKYGLKSLKCNNFEFEFFSASPPTKATSSKTEKATFIKDTVKQPTEDEMLLWSTEFMDAVQDDRKDSSDGYRL